MAQEPQYFDPHLEHLRALEARRQALASQPVAPSIPPEELQKRQRENYRNQMLGDLGLISGDKALGSVAAPLLRQAMEAQQKKATDHGEYDPLTGEFKYFPQYQRQRQEEFLNKDLERVQNLSAEGRRRWEADRQRADEQRALRQTIAAMKTPADPGSLSYAGTHPLTGEPVLLHSKHGPIYQGKSYGGPIAEKPQGQTAGERSDIAGMDSNIQGLDQAVGMLDKVKKAGGGSFSGVVPGYFADLHPVGQAIVTKMKSDEEKNAASLILYISDGIRQGRFGMTLTPQEKASAVNYNPSLFDNLDEMKRKGVQLKMLLERDKTNRLGSMARPGLPPPQLRGGGLGGPDPTAVPGGTGEVQLPPGWSITPVK